MAVAWLAAVAGLVLRMLAQVTVAVSAPATLAAGEPALVRVEVTAPAAATVRLTPPDVAPFTVASAARVPTAGGLTAPGWQRYEWRYVLAQPAGARGRYAFDPFAAEAQGRGLRATTATSRAWALDVRAPAPPVVFGSTAPVPGRPGAPAPSQPSTDSSRAQGRGTGVTFTARVTPERVYVGQQATYELTVAVDAAARGRIRRNPEFVPPELRGVLAVELPATHATTPAGDVHVYRRAIFPLAPGVVRIPSAQLTYALALGTSYFSREERLAVRSNAVRVVAVAAPTAGRPPEWDGAVGALRATARASAPAVRAGDAVEYTLRLEGSGNLALLPRPALAVPWADAVESGERVTVDSASAVVRGAKEFTWLLTPRAAGRFATPAVRYAFFDPARAQYDVAVASPVAVEVGAGVAISATGASRVAAVTERLAIRTVWRGAFGPPLPAEPVFWLLVALAPVPAALVAAVRAARTRRRFVRQQQRAPTLQQLARQPEPGAPALRRAVEQAFVRRVGFGPGAFGAPDAFARALRRVGVTAPTADRAAALARQLDAVAFGRAGDAAPDGTLGAGVTAELARAAELLLRDVDREAQPGTPVASFAHSARAWLLVVVCATAAGACATGAARRGAGVGAARFADGLTAYRTGDVAGARRAFLAAAAQAPAAPDAWANAGTASWAAGDTLGAALGWQRALRLEPAAADVRARLALLPAEQDGWIAGVPPVAPDWLAVPALGLAGCAAVLALVAAARARLRPGAWLWAWAVAVCASLAAAGVHAAASPAGLAVVATAGPLRIEPALDADPGPPADLTDVARVRQQHGVWSRVTLDGDREGWIENRRLVPLPPPGVTNPAASATEPPGHER